MKFWYFWINLRQNKLTSLTPGYGSSSALQTPARSSALSPTVPSPAYFSTAVTSCGFCSSEWNSISQIPPSPSLRFVSALYEPRGNLLVWPDFLKFSSNSLTQRNLCVWFPKTCQFPVKIRALMLRAFWSGLLLLFRLLVGTQSSFGPRSCWIR